MRCEIAPSSSLQESCIAASPDCRAAVNSSLSSEARPRALVIGFSAWRPFLLRAICPALAVADAVGPRPSSPLAARERAIQAIEAPPVSATVAV